MSKAEPRAKGAELTRFSVHRYPYGQTLTANSAADIALLDTNNNGELDADDDSLAPYYPGDDVVDWIGVSICKFWLPLLDLSIAD